MVLTMPLRVAAVATAILFIPACEEPTEPLASPTAPAVEEADWSYSGKTGPKNWGTLSEEYEACARGERQSPIDIVDPAEDGEPVEIDYKWSAATIINNGHSIQVNVKDGGSITVGKRTYDVAQFHFHSSSEHLVDGRSFPLEMHVVHRSRDGRLAVLGAFIEEGDDNKTYAKIWDDLPGEDEEGDEAMLAEPVNVDDLLPDTETASLYEGSLTTPPCAEGVQWVVLPSPVEMSKEQIEAFTGIHPANNRPVQPLNDREIVGAEVSSK